MDFARYLTPDQILLGVSVRDKWELLDRMIAAIVTGPMCRSQSEQVKQSIGETVLRREREQSTGVGAGFALPHGRVEGFTGMAAALAVLAKPLEFASLDGEPVRVACMVVTPAQSPGIALKVMGLIAGLLKDESAESFLLGATDPAAVHRFLQERQLGLDVPLLARDIMGPVRLEVRVDTPIRQVVRLMARSQVEAVAVLDADGRVVGEVSCDLLLRKGVPAFFAQLPSVAFARNFDPFDKYFENEAHSTAGNMMSREFAAVDEDATLMEIVDLLAVRGHARVYVVRDGRHVGTVDRALVLERILNL